MISKLIRCDVYRIRAADPYPYDYEETVARNVREQQADARPRIANPLASIERYDVVLLASPIWNVRAPMIMSTFAERYDFTGKTIFPVTTYAMSGLGTTPETTPPRARGQRSDVASRCEARRRAPPSPQSKRGCGASDSCRADVRDAIPSMGWSIAVCRCRSVEHQLWPQNRCSAESLSARLPDRRVAYARALMYGAGDVRVEDVPDARLIEPSDALVRVTRAAICGSDLWPYKSMPHDDAGRRMGHEFIGVVDAVGSDVATIKAGDLVVSPFLWSDGTCVFCREGLQSECLHGGRYGWGDVDGGQGEAVRVPQADGTLVVLPVGGDDALMASLLTLTDVMGTGHHAAVAANVGPGKTVAVVGDGAVGLCGVIAAKRLGAERIILLGSNPERIALGQEFGATDVVRERGEEAIECLREMTDGEGAHSVLECVGLEQAVETALKIARPGGAIGRVGVPEEETTDTGVAFWKNASMAGGPAPVRAYIEELLPDVLEGRIEPGRVFDRTGTIEGVPDGYRAMNDRDVLKFQIAF